MLVSALIWTSTASARISLPHWWIAKAMCIHQHESLDWHRTTDWRGRPSVDHGGLQIDVRTWGAFAPAAYPGSPAAASPLQQLTVAYRIWLANGHRFGGSQWYHSAAQCGVA